MKTLDEVIKAVHHCGLLTSFDDTYEYDGDCPYEDCSKCEQKRRLGKDILHYLKEFKRISARLEKIALGNITETLEKLDNPALTWDELRTMEGKPVWVEEYDAIDSTRGWRCCRWMLVEFVNDSYMDARNSDGEQYNFDKGESWQAYRKERE